MASLIEIHRLSGDRLLVDLEDCLTVADVKARLQEQSNLPARKLVLTCGGDRLRTRQKLADMSFDQTSVWTLLVAPPMRFDPSTMAVSGELQVKGETEEERETWSETHLRVKQQEWSKGAAIKSNYALEDMQRYMLQPKGRQVSLGLSVTNAPASSNRFSDESVGTYIDAQTFHHGADDSGTFSVRDKIRRSGEADCWMQVDYEDHLLILKFPHAHPFEVALPETFRGHRLYMHIFVWNGCACSLLPDPDEE